MKKEGLIEKIDNWTLNWFCPYIQIRILIGFIVIFGFGLFLINYNGSPYQKMWMTLLVIGAIAITSWNIFMFFFRCKEITKKYSIKKPELMEKPNPNFKKKFFVFFIIIFVILFAVPAMQFYSYFAESSLPFSYLQTALVSFVPIAAILAAFVAFILASRKTLLRY